MPEQYILQQSPVLRRHESGQRTGPDADWTAVNPILGKGEIGYALDTAVIKVGDGVTAWNALGSPGAVRVGTATLVAGAVTVTDASVTANSVIQALNRTVGGTPGALFVSAKVAATSFTITSTSGTDTSVVQFYVLSY